MNPAVRPLRSFFVSLKLTVVLLALSILLVFWATLCQADLGVWGVQQHFFHTFLVLEKIPGTPIFAPFPGGYTIGTLLLVNLIAAHLSRYAVTWRKLGIHLTHGGIILLLVGELASGLMEQHSTMRIEEGQTVNYFEHSLNSELAITNTSDANFDDVVAIPEERLAKSDPIQYGTLPFRVVVHAYYPNADLVQRTADTPSVANKGMGVNFTIAPLPVTYKMNERNLPGALVELIGTEGSIGTWMVYAAPMIPPQHFDYGGRSWKISMRFARTYEPFALTLLKFRNDYYPGTDIPKNYSSDVHLVTPGGKDDRDVHIYMNNPLRYAGLTFYQASFDGPTVTVLEVVRNPSWLMPYIACSLIVLGLLWQFGASLLNFIGKRRQAA